MNSDDFSELMATLADEEYRREFVSESISTGLAFQIRHLRDSRGWTQRELAERMPKAQQETVSQWENPNYGRYSVNTLKRVAAAFDVALIVRFAPFSDLAKWTLGLNPQRLAPPSFTAELEQMETQPVAYTASATTIPPAATERTSRLAAVVAAVDSLAESDRTEKEGKESVYNAAA